MFEAIPSCEVRLPYCADSSGELALQVGNTLAIRITRLSRIGPSTAAREYLVLLQMDWLAFAQDDNALLSDLCRDLR